METSESCYLSWRCRIPAVDAILLLQSIKCGRRQLVQQVQVDIDQAPGAWASATQMIVEICDSTRGLISWSDQTMIVAADDSGYFQVTAFGVVNLPRSRWAPCDLHRDHRRLALPLASPPAAASTSHPEKAAKTSAALE